MKKITIFLLVLFSFIGAAQVSTTGLIELSNDGSIVYSAQLDITDAQVTLTLVGPETRWLGIGFDAASMTAGKDVVIFDGTTLTDRNFIGIGSVPDLDSSQDWSVSSNTVNSGIRTLIATRARDTGDANDYVFRTSDTSINLVWAYSRFDDFVLAWHAQNRGMTTESLTLSQDEFELSKFVISPNPARSSLKLRIPSVKSDMSLTVYDVLGKKIYQGVITQLESLVDVSNWKSGIYLVKVTDGQSTQTKRFIKQ
jgi:hypothetical protein